LGPKLQSITEFMSWLESLRLSLFIRESWWAFPTVEAFHIIALTLVVGTIAVVDLRLLGLASTNRPVTELCAEVLPWTWGAFVLAAFCGSLMFISHTTAYYGNHALQIKMALLLLAGVNMLTFQIVTYRGVKQWDRDAAGPPPAKIAAAISLSCWIGVVFFGRWIGFTILPE
jgi:hypothetical protein